MQAAPDYRPDLDVAGLVGDALRADDHPEVVRLLQAAMPGAYFSPSAHGLLARAHAALGDQRRAQAEHRTSQLAVESVLLTGEGTRESPWSVLRIADEYDVLLAQGRRPRRQEVVRDQDRTLDHHECRDGSEAWFDVTALV